MNYSSQKNLEWSDRSYLRDASCFATLTGSRQRPLAKASKIYTPNKLKAKENLAIYQMKLVTSNRACKNWLKILLRYKKTEETTIKIIDLHEDGFCEKIERFFKKRVIPNSNEYSMTRSHLKKWMNKRSQSRFFRLSTKLFSIWIYTIRKPYEPATGNSRWKFVKKVLQNFQRRINPDRRF